MDFEISGNPKIVSDDLYDEFNRKFREESGQAINTLDQNINGFFKAYTSEYQERTKQKIKLKHIFSYAAIFVLLALVVVPLVLLCIAVIRKDRDMVIALSAAGFANALASIIAIPYMIAKQLFNYDEEKMHMGLVEKILDQNRTWHDNINRRT